MRQVWSQIEKDATECWPELLTSLLRQSSIDQELQQKILKFCETKLLDFDQFAKWVNQDARNGTLTLITTLVENFPNASQAFNFFEKIKQQLINYLEMRELQQPNPEFATFEPQLFGEETILTFFDIRFFECFFKALMKNANNTKEIPVDYAEKLFDKIKNVGILPNVDLINSLLNYYAMLKPSVVHRIFNKQDKMAVKPNLLTFQILIEVAKRNGDYRNETYYRNLKILYGYFDETLDNFDPSI